MHEKTMNFGFSDEAAETVFLKSETNPKILNGSLVRNALLFIISTM
jgi:hypothetical protein